MNTKMIYRKLGKEEVTRELFSSFIRKQEVTKCFRKIDGEWVIKEIPFIDDWTENDYTELIQCLRNTICTGGFVAGAFSDDKLKGFVSVEPAIFGGDNRYMDLSSIHISSDYRHKGIGTELFRMAKEWAKEHHAKKLYISAHSAVESQEFYRAMGCVEAAEYNKEHVEKEPCDCQLECEL